MLRVRTVLPTSRATATAATTTCAAAAAAAAAGTASSFSSSVSPVLSHLSFHQRFSSSCSNNNNSSQQRFASFKSHLLFQNTSSQKFSAGRKFSNIINVPSSSASAASALQFQQAARFVSSYRTFCSSSKTLRSKNKDDKKDATKSKDENNAIAGVYSLKNRTKEDEERERKKQQEEEEEEGDGGHNTGYLPFPEPFHTINIMAVLLLGNVVIYLIMNLSNDDWRDFMIDHFTLTHENWWKGYPLLTHSFYQENLLQLAIDVWLLWQFGRTQLGFLGNTRLTFFWMLCTLGGASIHIARQKIMLYYEMDPIEVRGHVYGPNPFILGLVGLEGLIFRNMNFLQNPPVPFLVLTAGVMIIDVWRIFTMKPEEHGASTGGALVAYIMWALPTRLLGLDKLTAAM